MGTSQTSPGKPNYRGLDLEKQISTGDEMFSRDPAHFPSASLQGICLLILISFSATGSNSIELRERQASVVDCVNHGSIRGSWPMAISGYPRGLCQEDEKSSCCTKDEGGPFGAAL